jgi:hypothetical protein
MNRKTRMLMMAVTANRTLTNFRMRHFCKLHKKNVDKHHLDCNLLNKDLAVPINHFNEMLKETSIYDMESTQLKEIAGHFAQLERNIGALEQAGLLLQLNDCIRPAQ